MPDTNVAELSLFKQFSLAKLREGSRLEYRIEAFNALNHPQFCGSARRSHPAVEWQSIQLPPEGNLTIDAERNKCHSGLRYLPACQMMRHIRLPVGQRPSIAALHRRGKFQSDSESP
jgi:hypothetical protein